MIEKTFAVKTKVNNQVVESTCKCVQFTSGDDLLDYLGDANPELVQEVANKVNEITRIRAQDKVRVSMQEQDPTKKLIKELNAKVKTADIDTQAKILEFVNSLNK